MNENKINKDEEKDDLKGWILPFIFGSLLALTILLVVTKPNNVMGVMHSSDKASSESPQAELKQTAIVEKVDKKPQKPKEKLQQVKTASSEANQCFVKKKSLTKSDEKIAKIAWKYFENNYQKETGLFNSANNYTSTSMWDTGSALAATIAAEDFGFITKKEFDDKITALIKTMVQIELFEGKAPNKVYSTKTTKMVDYTNKEKPNGIGVSILDLARLISWFNILTNKHPRFKHQVKQALNRWDFENLIKDGRMYGIKRYPKTGEVKYFQEGRLGYEQYAAKILQRENHELPISAVYNNEHRKDVDIYGIKIATDNRSPEFFHVSNSVVTESYILDAIENGFDEENSPLIKNIYQVQKRRWEDTGIVTAVSEDNINRKPYFIYNTIFSGGRTWVAKTSKGEIMQQNRTISNKAAIALALLYPDDEYSSILMNKVNSAYDPKKGWYSGIYENGEGYNSSTTANTNGVILSALLYKKFGPSLKSC